MTGTESPTKSAMSSAEVIATRSSGACFEDDPGGSFEDCARACADQRTRDQEHRQAWRRQAHRDHEQDETYEHRDRAEGEHAKGPQSGRCQLRDDSCGEHQEQCCARQRV
jgi:hypothetical protein